VTAWKAKFEEAQEDIDGLRDALDNIQEISASHHIPVEWVEYPNARIGIDANGHVSVVYFECAEVVLA
jgi:hypothetical protein